MNIVQTSPLPLRFWYAAIPLFVISTLVCLAAWAEEREGKVAPHESTQPIHWTYEGEAGPANWGKLSPAYAVCDQGKNQSPVDLVTSRRSRAIPLIFDYKMSALNIAHTEDVVDIIDNGHTMQITVDDGSTLTTRRDVYSLAQFHFHTPAEHTIGGKSFPMEAHFVHQSAKGTFAVVAALFVEGAPNANLEKLIANFPGKKGETNKPPGVQLNLGVQLPESPLVYSYIGSFTTPPCTENVEWFVLQTPVTASRAQLEAFSSRLGHNNRPVQPLHRRTLKVNEVRKSTNP